MYTIDASKGGVYGVRACYATVANSTVLAATVDEGTDAACTEQSEGLVFYKTNLPSLYTYIYIYIYIYMYIETGGWSRRRQGPRTAQCMSHLRLRPPWQLGQYCWRGWRNGHEPRTRRLKPQGSSKRVLP